MNLINVPSASWTHAFSLPSHYTVGPTACEPTVAPYDARPVRVTGLPLPLIEDFGDAFEGKCFVRLPRRTPEQLHISGRGT
jgi:hypothetical protein